jgi:hypothetical protein
MRKPSLAALAGLLALAAAAGPAAADPVRLDEAGLGGVAAGAELSFSNQQLTSTSTSTTFNSSSVRSATQAMRGQAGNRNYSTALSSRNVLAAGNSVADVRGSIAR